MRYEFTIAKNNCDKITQLFYFFIFVASINNSMSIKCCLCFSIKQTWGLLSDMSKMWGKAPLVSFLILFYSLLVRVWQVSSSQKVSGPCCRNTFTVRTDWPLVDNTWTHTEQAAEHFRKWCTEIILYFYHLK